MTDILIVEDNKELSGLLCDFLRAENYTVSMAESGEKALSIYEKYGARLVVLDIMLPGMDGFAVCRKIREESNTPILIVSAKTEKEDKLNGLILGADDYITKPFNPLEVVARVKTQIRRYVRYNNSAKTELKEIPAEEYDVRGLVINKDTHKCTLYGKEIALTPIEFSILWYLCENRGKVLKREYLIDEVWQGDTEFVDAHALTVAVKRLRDKLEDDTQKPEYIKTVYGIGYTWAVNG